VHAINANKTPAPAIDDLPVLTTAELDADTHGVFRRYRADIPS
jgi:hypothetical protein